MLENKNKILIVDDEPENIEILFTLLHKQNYQFLVASNGEDCLDVLKKETPSAIIMDWEMPGMTGIETIKLIKANPKTVNIPIIMATGKMISSENLETALLAGANDYLRKPFDKIEIIARIQSMIKLREENKKVVRLEKKILQIEIDKIKNELEANQKILTTSTLKLIQSQENTKKTVDDLINIKKNCKEENKESINKIVSTIKINSFSLNWNEFEMTFERVYNTFYDNLNNRFPDLTPNEKKICAFIKLNLSNKQISSITFSNENAIKKAKTRLRKKIGIDVSVNLSGFIQSF